MADAKNGKGGFKEFAKHEKDMLKSSPNELTGAAAPAPVASPAAPKAVGDRKPSVAT
jgi:hypothetical protein